MQPIEIFGLQLLYSLMVWTLLARWVLAPKLRQLDLYEALFWLSLPHMFRHIGLSFLVPGLAAGPLPGYFADPTAWGDLLASLLAIGAMVMLRTRRKGALTLAWFFNIVGTVDLLKALSNPEVVPDLGTTWYIPTMLVPLLLVTHALSFMWLVNSKRHAADNQAAQQSA